MVAGLARIIASPSDHHRVGMGHHASDGINFNNQADSPNEVFIALQPLSIS